MRITFFKGKFKLAILAMLSAAVLGCAALLCVNIYGNSNRASAETGDISAPTANVSSAIAGGETSDNGGIYAPEREVKATSAESLATAWGNAVSESVNGNGKQVTFTLTEDWTAPGTGVNSSFGSNIYFLGGSILVPEGANIVLDLNGYTITREIGTYIDEIDGELPLFINNGQVITCQGTLEIIDSSTSASGNIRGGQSNGGAGGVLVDGGNLTLTEGEIWYNLTSYGGSGKDDIAGGVGVINNGTFTMNGGAIDYNETWLTGGGGVGLSTGSTFIMNGGYIGYNIGSDGGGCVAVYKNCTFKMNGGNIARGNANYGGGVIVYHGGTFELYDGTISDNKTNYGDGGGVCVSGGTFKMYGGLITRNTAQYGAGVSVVDINARFEMSGGEISGNTTSYSGGGVSYGPDPSTSMSVSGSARIVDNHKTNGTLENLVITQHRLQIANELKGARIGVTLSTGTGDFTEEMYNWGPMKAEDAALYFFSDAGKKVTASSSNWFYLQITDEVAPTQTALTWQYFDNSVWVNITTGSLTLAYSGTAYSVRAVNTYGNTIATTVSAVKGTTSTIKNAGDYGANVSANVASSYTNPTLAITVKPKEVNISWSTETLRYTGSVQYPQPVVNGIIGNDSVIPEVNAAEAGINAGSGYKVAVTGLTGYNVDNYKFPDGVLKYSTTYTIYRAQLAKPTASGSFNYNGTEQTYSVGGFNSALMSLGGTYAATNAGDYTATVSLSNTTNYEWTDGSVTPVNINWSINKIPVFVSGISVANKPYDGNKTATVNTSTAKISGAIAADLANLGIELSAGSEFDSKEVGLRSITVSGIALTGSAAGNYTLDFDEVQCYAQIYPATVTISGVVANGKTYDGTTAVTFDTDSAVITGAFADELSGLTITADGYFNSKNVGENVEVTVQRYLLTGEYAGNYYIDFANSEQSLTADISKAEIEVTLGKTEYKATYGNGLKITFSQSSPVSSESVTLALEYWNADKSEKLSSAPTNAGTYVVKVVVDDTDPNLVNYDIASTGISEATVTIEKATLTVTVEDLEIEYGSDVPENDDYTLIYSGWLNGDAAIVEPSVTVNTDYAKGDDVGEYELTLTAGTLANYNIVVADENGSLWVVAKSVTVRIDNKTSVYGATEVALTSNGTADMGITLEREDGTDVGKYVISGDWDNDNYDITFINGVYEITKATLTVTANDKNITYGDEAANDGVTYSGFVNGDDESVLIGTLAYRYTYTQYGNTGNYGIMPYGLSTKNYEIIYAAGLLKVGKKAATVTVSNAASDITSVPADRADAAQKMKYVVDGTVNGDNLNVVLTIAGTNNEASLAWPAVGTYIVTGAAGNANYSVSFVYEDGATSGTYTITQGTLIITANTLILSYGESIAFSSDWEEAVTVEGLPEGATLTSLKADGVIDGSLTIGETTYTVGADIYDASGNRISYTVLPAGFTSTSYNIIYKPSKLMIEPKTITVTLDNKSSVYGEDLKELTASTTELVNYNPATNGNVVEFLGIQGLAKASGSDAGNYSITATGSTNKNYRVTFVSGVYTITQYEVTVVWVSGNENANNFNYTYDAAIHSPIATFEMHGVTYSSTDEGTKVIEIMGSGTNAGDYKAQAFLLNPNLKFSTASGNELTKDFTINTKQLTVTWYKDKADIGKADKVLDTSDVVTYNYRVGNPWAPVAVVEGIEDADKSIVSIEVSGKQNSVNKGTPYVAELWIHGSNNYSVANSDKSIEFEIVMVAPGDFKWEGETSYVYNGVAQQPVATASNNAYFIYTVELLDDEGNAIETVPTAISVGKYRITAEPKDVNFLIPEDKKSYEFEITPFVATVVWSGTSFEYNGAKQVPTAYYEDVYGQHVELEVKLADGETGVEGGNEYHVSVTLSALNYTFKNGDELVTTLENTYTIAQKKIEVSWNSVYTKEDGSLKWEAVYNNGDESESVTFVATMNNEVETLALDVKVYWQANAGDEPVEVNKVHDAGIYTWSVALSDTNGDVNGNYTVVNAEQSFEITKPQLTVKAAGQTVNTGAPVQGLTATFDGLVGGETAENLGLEVDGKYNWLDTNYNRNSAYLDSNEYDTPAYEDLQTLADLDGVKGYFVVLTDSAIKLNVLNDLLKNYDWTFEYGKITIIAIEGDVKIIAVKEYNGEDQKPNAQYKNAVGNWVDLNVVVYEDEDYTQLADSDEVKNVGTYYLLLSKCDDDNTPLAGAETSGEFKDCVKKTFTITKRQIEIKISDNSADYGTVTSEDYQNYLNWAYANEDPNHKPLGNDELDIVLKLDLAEGSFDSGNYLNAGVYAISGSWNEDMTNYEVRFVGSNGTEGVFEVKLAKISFKESGEYNQVIEEDGRLTMSLGEMDGEGTSYVNFSFTGYQNTDLVQIYYSNPYNLDANDPDKFAPDKDATVVQTASPIFYRTGNDSRYFVNFRIEIPNHEPYYGQWKALVLVDTIYIRILFVDGKTYDVVYGDAIPDGKTLATELWDKGYIDKLSTGIPNNKFKEYIESGLVTAKVVADKAGAMTRGSYSIIFEGFENVEDGKYQVTYKENITDPDSKATNVDRYVVTQRDLTITWDKTSFEYDGEAHIPVPDIDGWTRAEGTETVNGATVYTFTNTELGKTITLTVRTNGGDFTTVGSENVIIATIDDDNYALDSFNATRAVSITAASVIDPVDPVKPVIQQSGIAPWVAWVLGIVAVLALLVIIVLAVKNGKGKASGDDDGFYDDVEEGS